MCYFLLTFGVRYSYFTVISSIDIKVNAPPLGHCISKINDLGLELADRNLSKSSIGIERIEFIMGTENAYCLPLETIVFGSSDPSMFLKTNIGIMLIGNVQDLEKI